jgi:hypothetical protein
VEHLLAESVWAGPLLWAAFYISDFSFTMMCARLYKAQHAVEFEGSYEITPTFQADVDALRWISPRFLLILLGSTIYVFIVRLFAGTSSWLLEFYVLVLGMMLLLQATIHIRHLRNWFLFRNAAGLLDGRIRYPRGVMLRMSSFELTLFTALYTGLYTVTGSRFVLGGAIACCVMALNHYRLAKMHDVSQMLPEVR